jgi:hypothetical protein
VSKESSIRPWVSLAVPDPKLWSPESPHLYGLRIHLLRGGEKVDTVESYFGMRTLEVRAEGEGARILLNGKPYFQVGPLDQGYWPDGIYTAPTDEALRWDLEVTKELGFNMSRKHVKVEPARWYYWADRLGVLVWQDMPSANNTTSGSQTQFEGELRRMVESFRNHPSIIMWVVFNEGWGQFDTERLTEMVKRIDPHRLVSNASGWTDKNVGDIIDVHSYPSPSAPRPETTRASVLGEFGGLGLGVEGHLWQKEAWGYQNMSDVDQLARRFDHLMRGVYHLKETRWLNAAVYTQLTDVESETNGLITYDRRVKKIEPARVARAARGELGTVETTIIVPTAKEQPAKWRYTLTEPSDNWTTVGFDDSKWKEGLSGFGLPCTPGSVVNTEWNTSDIWLRRKVEIPAGVDLREILVRMHHDENAEVYINGMRAVRIGGYTIEYEDFMVRERYGTNPFKHGTNEIAVHCSQTVGGQYIDVGLVTVKEKPAKPTE